MRRNKYLMLLLVIFTFVIKNSYVNATTTDYDINGKNTGGTSTTCGYIQQRTVTFVKLTLAIESENSYKKLDTIYYMDKRYLNDAQEKYTNNRSWSYTQYSGYKLWSPEYKIYRYFQYDFKNNNKAGAFVYYGDFTTDQNNVINGYNYKAEITLKESDFIDVNQKTMYYEGDPTDGKYGRLNQTALKNYIVNNLNSILLNKFNIYNYDDVTRDSINSNGLIIIEPVYAYERGSCYRSFHTMKSLAGFNAMDDWHLEYLTRTYGNDSFYDTFYLNGTYNNYFGIDGSLDSANVMSVNNKYGFGIVRINDYLECDPNKSCCYDNNGVYHDNYYGTNNNYKCSNYDTNGSCIKVSSCVSNCSPKTDYQTIEVSCDNGEIDNSKIEQNLTTDVCIEVPESSCDNSTIVANITFTQTIDTLSYDLSPNKIYSGGGFGLSLEYKNTAKWSINSIDVPSCVNLSDDYINKLIIDRITTNFKESFYSLQKNGYNMTMPNSNDIDTNSDNTNTGTWSCRKDLESDWNENSIVVTTCTFYLKDAYINRKTGKVEYGNYSGNNDYISEGKKYFTPIYRSFSNNIFSIKTANSDGYNISVISGKTVNLKSSCSVQLYKGSIDKDNYYYRPIDLSNIFPNGRNAGFNWYKWYTENKDNLINRLNDTYNKMEYEVYLDSAIIGNLKSYNRNTNYFDMSKTITNDGNSDMIYNNNNNNSNSYGISKTDTATHSKLGECNSNSDCIEGGNS